MENIGQTVIQPPQGHTQHQPEPIGDGKFSWVGEILDSAPEGKWKSARFADSNRMIAKFSVGEGIHPLFFKTSAPSRQSHLSSDWHDALAYEINRWSGLDVVPRTVAMKALSEETQSRLVRLPQGDKLPIIVQEGVCAKQCSEETRVDLLEPRSAQHAMLFAMLVRLGDSQPYKTLISPSGKVWEVDFRILRVSFKNNHWLLRLEDGPAYIPFSRETQDRVAEWDLTALGNLIQEMCSGKNGPSLESDYDNRILSSPAVRQKILSSARQIQLWLAKNPEGTPKQLQQALLARGI